MPDRSALKVQKPSRSWLPSWFAAPALLLLSGAAHAQSIQTSTLADQKDLSVTVYNSNIALVRDVRRLQLAKGAADIRFMDIAAHVNPATVHIASLSAPSDLAVLEQNYEYDLLNPAKLLDKYVGKEVTLVRLRTENNSTREDAVRAVLLANNEQPVWKVGNDIVTGMAADRYVFPEVPENLYSKPTLVWLLESKRSGEQTIEASYLTDEMNWNADYVLTLGADPKVAELNGWTTIVNHSGTALKNAQLQLVAGQLNRIPPPAPMAMPLRMEAMAAPAAPQFTQEAISEYHLYTLGRRTTLLDNETKQISLLASAGVHVEKSFEVKGQTFYYQNSLRPGQPQKDPVQVHLKFKNSEANGLGIPLPGGEVRVYQSDSKGRTQFIGEDRIDHTPKDELLDLHIGSAFDIVEERKQTEYQRLGERVYEEAFEIALRNHKNEAVTVLVNEPLPSDWTMLESNFKYEKTAAFAARFTVSVEANAEAVLKYRVRVRL